MNLDIEILFKTEEGNLYSLIFSEYKPDSNIIIPVVEISLALKEQKNNTNPLKVFSFIIKKIVEYLSHREVILYYYADSTPIYYRDTNKHHFISPQHFRNYLFYTLFVKERTSSLERKFSARTILSPLFPSAYASYFSRKRDGSASRKP